MNNKSYLSREIVKLKVYFIQKTFALFIFSYPSSYLLHYQYCYFYYLLLLLPPHFSLSLSLYLYIYILIYIIFCSTFLSRFFFQNQKENVLLQCPFFFLSICTYSFKMNKCHGDNVEKLYIYRTGTGGTGYDTYNLVSRMTKKK